MRAPRLFCPDFDEAEFLFQLRIGHDFVPQRAPPGRDHLNHCLHRLANPARSISKEPAKDQAGDLRAASMNGPLGLGQLAIQKMFKK